MESLLPFNQSELPFTLSASLRRAGEELRLEFRLHDPRSLVEGAPVTPFSGIPPRADELWRHTCFEAFWGRKGEAGYWELNLEPTGRAWNLYRFDGYRQPQPPRACDDFVLESVSVGSGTVECRIRSRVPLGSLEALLCAIVKREGATDYLASAHAGAKPDFHLRAGFRLQP